MLGDYKSDHRTDSTRHDPAQTQRIERQPCADPVHNTLRKTRDLILASGEPGTDRCRELSMGMTGDMELAIAEGSTIVRVGTAIFGERAFI